MRALSEFRNLCATLEVFDFLVCFSDWKFAQRSIQGEANFKSGTLGTARPFR